MKQDVLGRLVECGADRPSGLELVVFFYRRPRAYLPTERLVSIVGHARQDVEASVGALVDAGFIVRRPGPQPEVSMYRRLAASSRGWVAASSPDG
jgi:hypothetical protein